MIKNENKYQLLFLLILVLVNLKLFSADVFYDRKEQMGMSFLNVTDISKDNKGFMWIATSKGLNRWDGYNFKQFFHDENDLNSLSSNFINALKFDKSGLLWIATSNGLNCYNPETGNFNHFFHNPEDETSISSNNVLCLAEDLNGVLWIGTESGLNSYNKETKKFEHYNFEDLINIEDLNYGNIRKLFYDSDNNLWLGFLYSGTLKFNVVTKEKKFYHKDKTGNFISSVNDALIWDNDKMLFCTWGVKVLEYSNSKDEFSTWEANEYLDNPIVLNIEKDSYGGIWVVDHYNKIVHLSPELKVLEKYEVNSEIFKIPSNQINCLFSDRENIWVGTTNQGFFQINYSNKIINDLHKGTGNFSELSKIQVLSISPGRPGEIIIGTSNRKILIYNDIKSEITEIDIPEAYVYRLYWDKASQKLFYGSFSEEFKSIDLRTRKIKTEAKFPSSYAVFGITSNDSQIFITPWDQGLLIINKDGSIYNPAKEKWQRDFSTLNLLYDDDILWMATYNNGVISYNIKSGDFRSHLLTDDKTEKFFSNQVNIITKLRNGQILISTNEDGLCSMDRENLKFKKIGGDIGLNKLHIKSIFEDNQNNIWIVTEQKVIKTDVNFKNYTEISLYDGLNSGIEHLSSTYLSETKKIFIGGQEGVQYLNPTVEVEENAINKVNITDLRIFEKKIENGDKILNGKTISYCDTVSLSHNMNFITIDFSSMNYNNQTNREFSYKLEGVNSEWINVPYNKNSVTYSNLSPGEYDFLIKVSNDHGIWTDNLTKLHISIFPPFWRTSLFRFLIIAFVVATLLIYSRLKDYNYKQEKKKLELIVKERTAVVVAQKEELEKANDVKNKFFNIIAHDLKNPVSSVVQLTELLKDNFSSFSEEQKKEIIDSSVNSANSTLNLLDDLLLWARSQINKITFTFEPQNIYDLAQSEIINHFQQASNKRIVLINELQNGTFVMADSSSVRTVFRNLISNSIKFSKPEGVVIIGGRADASTLTIFVKDFGIGMSEKTLRNLFRLSNKESIDGTVGEKGSGLGLNLCKEFVEKNSGNIWSESEPGKGSTFYFTLPILN